MSHHRTNANSRRLSLASTSVLVSIMMVAGACGGDSSSSTPVVPDTTPTTQSSEQVAIQEPSSTTTTRTDDADEVPSESIPSDDSDSVAESDALECAEEAARQFADNRDQIDRFVSSGAVTSPFSGESEEGDASSELFSDLVASLTDYCDGALLRAAISGQFMFTEACTSAFIDPTVAFGERLIAVLGNIPDDDDDIESLLEGLEEIENLLVALGDGTFDYEGIGGPDPNDWACSIDELSTGLFYVGLSYIIDAERLTAGW